MQKQIKITLFILGLSLVSALNTSVVATPTCQPQKVESITLTPMGNNMHLLSWDALQGTGPYSLTVFNLTTQTLHSTCNTTSTSSVVMGLVGRQHVSFFCAARILYYYRGRHRQLETIEE